MKRIVFLNNTPLLGSYIKNFYIDYLIDNNFNVEYWDVTNLYFKDLEIDGEVRRDFIKEIYTLEEFSSKVKEINSLDAFFIVMVTYEMMVAELFIILTQNKCKLCFFARSGIPIPNRSIVDNILILINNDILSVFKKLSGSFLSAIYKKVGLVKEYDFVFVSGASEYDKHRRVSRTILVNHFDYDEYLADKNHEKIVPYKYCVFLDDYLTYSSDLKMLGIKTIDHDEYYDSLNRFFEYIERQYGISVVIAAHPKSDYHIVNRFNGRRFYRNVTNNLVKYCEFVIAHLSTSISYSVLHKKPIIFIYTDTMERTYAYSYMKFIINFSKLLNGSLYNINSVVRDNMTVRFKEVNPLLYDDYKYKYLTSYETEDKLSKHIVLSFFD